MSVLWTVKSKCAHLCVSLNINACRNMSCTHRHTLTHNRIWFIREDVIRGIVFSDSQREFPSSHCHNSDQTQGDRERQKDRQTKKEMEKEMCDHMKWQTTLKSVTSQHVTQTFSLSSPSRCDHVRPNACKTRSDWLYLIKH